MDHIQSLERNDISQATRTLFQLWTLKESYTKAIGSGLGFDMSRIEYDFDSAVLNVDGSPLYGWLIRSFFLVDADGLCEHEYAVSVCYRAGEGSEQQPGSGAVQQELPGMEIINAVALLNLATNPSKRGI
jgi:phosphopantetheinyl transferase